ncbi:hypothetical protein HX794_03810 [Pseudomonas costantinii]|uniref:hypothetical protein n=1 Tax=Pseudomonas costantinii TaxID=168469 RepID=UPI0015A193E3|nr:hypothetical protein [Pseudomonas costantinii]NVZ18760.1 hypothetical protein [Pseudomonas costantinii]
MYRVSLTDMVYSPVESNAATADIARSAREITEVLQRHVATIGQERYSSVAHHYLCSTMMDSIFSAAAVEASSLLGPEHQVPTSFTHAYECACWGYCLRHHLKNKGGPNSFAISILDVNSMEMTMWKSNPAWGKSGFGITTLFFSLMEDEQSASPVMTGAAAGGNNIIAFASVAKQAARQFQSELLSLPFFPDNMSVPLRRALKEFSLLGDCHATYGHAFGSDPWIAVLHEHARQTLAGRRVVLGSLALRGYYCFANIHIAPSFNVRHF